MAAIRAEGFSRSSRVVIAGCRRLSRICVALALVACGAMGALAPACSQAAKINGLMYLIQNDPADAADGLLKWEAELNKRGLTALIKASKPVLEKYPELFRKLAREGHVIMGGYAGICWDMPYAKQYQAIKETKEYMETLTGRKMLVFACQYSSYDENTVKAAQALGVPYVLARGTEDVRALLYKPKEYNVRLLEVSNVEFGKMGKGSLCDISLFSRGATEADFSRVFEESVAKQPDSMILVSHPHIGGVKAGYWKIYEAALASSRVAWQPFEGWMKKVKTVELAYRQIPENREVEYLEPKPAVPLEQLENLPDAGRKIVMFHNGKGPMCVEAKRFVDGLKYPLEEHLITEKNFLRLLESYRVQYPKSLGLSSEYGYFPIFIVRGKAYSGFNEEIRTMILKDIGK